MNAYCLVGGEVYDNGNFESKDLQFIPSQWSGRMVTLDCDDHYILPGMIDIHTHGCMNVDFNHITEEGLQQVNEFFLTQGVTSWLASIVTDSKENMMKCAKLISAYSKLDSNGCLGVHLEGPFLSKEYRGSMPDEYLQNFDYFFLKEAQLQCDGAIKYITVAPEVDDVLDGIQLMKNLNIVVSLGHSAATYGQAMQAIDQGAATSTHTFNAMRLMHQHEPAIAGAALASAIYCEIICDGLHLHPHTVEMLMKIKGADKLIAVTDSIQAAGLADGEYQLGAQQIVVIDGDARLKHEDVRAGSTLTMLKALKNTMDYTKKPLHEILPLFIDNPADLFAPHLKSFSTQQQFNAIVLNKQFDIVHIIQNGKHIV